MKKPPQETDYFFDTLSNYDIALSAMESGSELCDWLFAPFSVQNYCCSMISSPITLTNNAHWGSGREFDSSIVYVRCSPPGRMGKQLLQGETRVISILLICQLTGRSKITIFRLFIMDGLMPTTKKLAKESGFDESLPPNSHGPACVPVTALLVWENHFDNMSDYQRSVVAVSTEGHHMITASCLKVRTVPLNKHVPTQLERVVAGHHDFPVARILTGMPIEDRLRHAIEETTVPIWTQALDLSMRKFGNELAKTDAVSSAETHSLRLAWRVTS